MVKTYVPPYVRARRPQRRSNRMLTQHAVEHVIDYVNNHAPKPGEWNYFNTQVRIDEDLSLTVSLLGRPILVIDRTESGYLDKVYVCSGEFYDNEGNPSNMTRERLTGLLAALGDERVIPKKVRVFMNYKFPEDEAEQRKDAPRLCYVGSGDNKILFNEDYATVVAIDTTPYCLIFENRSQDAGNLG